jgi:hypothetical protein
VDVISDQDDSASGSGWFAEIIGNVTSNAAIVGEVSAAYPTGTLNSRAWSGEGTAYTFLGGGRASLHGRRVVPFGQVLVGWVRTEAEIAEGSSDRVTQWSDNYWALAAGGGADIRLGGNLGVHAAIDLMRTSRGSQSGDYTRTWRMRAGLIFPMR